MFSLICPGEAECLLDHDILFWALWADTGKTIDSSTSELVPGLSVTYETIINGNSLLAGTISIWATTKVILTWVKMKWFLYHWGSGSETSRLQQHVQDIPWQSPYLPQKMAGWPNQAPWGCCSISGQACVCLSWMLPLYCYWSTGPNIDTPVLHKTGQKKIREKQHIIVSLKFIGMIKSFYTVNSIKRPAHHVLFMLTITFTTVWGAYSR